MRTLHRTRTLLGSLVRFVKWRSFGQGGWRNDTSEWRSVVGQIIQNLEDLNRSTECDFLAAGEKLAEFRSTAGQIASDLAVLTDLIAGEHGRSFSQTLAGMLEQSKNMDARIEQSGRTLEQVRDLSCRVRLAFAEVRNTVSTFRALCTLTRIETSRLGTAGDGFGDLAAEVKPLSEIIQSSGESVLEASSGSTRASSPPCGAVNSGPNSCTNCPR